MNSMTIHPHWRFNDVLTVRQAAALIVGVDPKYVRTSITGAIWLNDGGDELDPIGLTPIFQALINAINRDKLRAILQYDADPYYTATRIDNLQENDYWRNEKVAEVKDASGEAYVIKLVPNWEKTTIDRDDLVDWLTQRGCKMGFFFPGGVSDAPDYLDPKNPRYAPKLAAAVRAWQAVIYPKGKHPKQALAKWLRENAAGFGLADDEGKPNETGIEEAAKVANWQPGGGAPKTLGE